MKSYCTAKCKWIAWLSAYLPFMFLAFEVRAMSGNECDTIFTKDGRVMIVRIEKVSEREIVYSDCLLENGLKRAILLRSVKEVRSQTFGGSSNRILSKLPVQIDAPTGVDSSQSLQMTDSRRIHKLATLSFIFGVMSLIGLGFVYTLGFGLFVTVPLSIILGFIAIKRIRRNNLKYKGKRLAIIGIVLSFIVLAVVLKEVGEVLIYGLD